MTEAVRQRDIAELSDEEFLNEFAGLQAQEQEAARNASPEEKGEDQAPVQSEEPVDESEGAGGAVSEEAAETEEEEGGATTAEDADDEDGNDESAVDESGPRSSPHQGEETSVEASAGKEESPADPDASSALAKVLAPLKAAKRTITIDSVDQARQLMQMGVDYSRKMEAMKPYQRMIKSLERADLLDEGKLNFLIDLHNKRPEAIQKLLKEGDIDPLELDLGDDGAYQPNDHMIGESEMAVDEVLDTIRDSGSFDTTVKVITGWDTASKRTLMDNPQVIRYLNEHIESGIYEMIQDRLARDRVFGKHVGLSDLEAYKAVGDAMHEEGAFNAPNPTATSAAGGTDQGRSQDSVKDRKRAASPTKGTAGAAKSRKVPDFASMTDEEIENYDWRKL